MLGKISPVTIVVEHLRTLTSNRTGKTSYGDLILFYLVPFSVAVALVTYLEPNGAAFSNIVITSLSVFAALLFNLMILVLDAIRKEKSSKTSRERLLLLMKETYCNVAYAVFICLVTIAILLIPYFQKTELPVLLQTIIWTIAYALLLNFLLTLAMILKRMHVIFVNLIE